MVAQYKDSVVVVTLPQLTRLFRSQLMVVVATAGLAGSSSCQQRKVWYIAHGARGDDWQGSLCDDGYCWGVITTDAAHAMQQSPMCFGCPGLSSWPAVHIAGTAALD